jgi:hypothetical protein
MSIGAVSQCCDPKLQKKQPTIAQEKEAIRESRPLRRGAYGFSREGILPVDGEVGLCEYYALKVGNAGGFLEGVFFEFQNNSSLILCNLL